MADLVRVRRLPDDEGQGLLRTVRRGEPKATKSVIRYRRGAMVVLASAGGNTVPATARQVDADEVAVREVIHRFSELGMRALDPRWAGGRPRRISAEGEELLVAPATCRRENLCCPFTHWSVRRSVGYLTDNAVRIVPIGRERARQLLVNHEVTFQRTKTWKESPDPKQDTKLARIEQVLGEHPDRMFAFDEFGPLGCAPTPGCCWAPRGCPQRLPAAVAHELSQADRGAGTSTAATRSPRTGSGGRAGPRGRDRHPCSARSLRATRPDPTATRSGRAVAGRRSGFR
jgi:hypothetical protein